MERFVDKFNDIGPVVLGVFVIAFVLYVAARLRSKPETLVTAEERERIAYEAAPKCAACGEVATHQTPTLARERGSWLRKLFAAPPSYRRVVEPMARPTLCASHAHVADALVDQFVFGVRQKHAELNAKIAAEAAGFEQETLLRMLSDSLTDQQKRARRAPTAIRPVPAKNGTEDS